jgi:hypothetical protein
MCANYSALFKNVLCEFVGPQIICEFSNFQAKITVSRLKCAIIFWKFLPCD